MTELVVSERYRVIRELGRGGMATVYLALDLRYDREVAIKVLDPDVSAGVAADRFLREIAVAAKLTHPHIVPLLDSGATGPRLWFVMPVLEGRALRARIDDERQLPIADAVRIAREVALALGYAHSRGVVHRDVKPENILLSGGTAAVADFGVAKIIESGGAASLTATGVAIGTAYYMSPEQTAGDLTLDGRSDVYSLGCTLYEMLTGEPPYIGNSVQAVMAKRFTDPVPSARRLRDSISPALDDVIAHAMAKSPADRFPTADAFAEALRSTETGTATITTGTPRAGAPSVRRWSRRNVSIAALCVASLAAVTVVFVRGRRANETSLARAGAAPRSIAVLPFSDVSQKKDQEYFSTGMTDELIGALSAVSGLRVAARTSSYALANRASDPGEIGRRLHVDAILEGSVRKDGDHVRVVAELVSVMTGFPIWSQTFDKRLADVFVLQEDIAQAIVVAVRLQIADQRTIVQRATVDLGAYDAYLRGRLAWNKRTAASLVEADGWFRQAVDRDPKYARAWAGLADVHIIQALNFYAPAAENYEQGKAAALKALALDSTLAEAHTSLGAVQFLYDLDARAAEKSFQRAIALDPNYPAAHYFYAIFAGIGQPAVAEREAALAHALDPLSPPIAQGPGIVLIIQDKNAEAIAPLREAIALQPDYYFPHAWLAHALAATGKREEAVSEARRAVELAPDNTLVLAYLGEVYAMTGDRAKALAVVAQLDSLSKTRPVPGVFIARVYDNLGDTESALRWLDRAVASHEGQLTQLLWPGTFSHIAGDTRFQKLTRKLALTPVITAAPSGAHHAP